MASWKCPNCDSVLMCEDNIPAHTPQGPAYGPVDGECENCGEELSDEWSLVQEFHRGHFHQTCDSNGNAVLVSPHTTRTKDGLPVVVVVLADDPRTGYLAACEAEGGFGDHECPSSYGRRCLTWFGEGERYPNALSAIAAVCDAQQ